MCEVSDGMTCRNCPLGCSSRRGLYSEQQSSKTLISCNRLKIKYGKQRSSTHLSPPSFVSCTLTPDYVKQTISLVLNRVMHVMSIGLDPAKKTVIHREPVVLLGTNFLNHVIHAMCIGLVGHDVSMHRHRGKRCNELATGTSTNKVSGTEHEVTH